MPTTRRNAAANTTSLPLDGCSISLSGKLSSFGGHTHASLETVVCNLGGKVTKSVNGDTTHVASTDADYKSNSPKVAAAKDKGLHLISPQWILDCGAQHKKIDEAAFSWTAQARPPSNGSTAATSNATNGTTTAGKKRPIDVANSTDDHKLASKKPELAKADGTKIDGTPSDEAPKEEKRFSEGQFIKKNDVSIPLDEYCNMTAYQVYVEPGSGMIWDASLNQTNAGMNNNKFYRIQVCLSLPFPFQFD